MKRFLLFLPLLALPLLHCGDDDDVPVTPVPAGDGGAAPGSDAGKVEEADKPLVPANKVDLLFAIDNSSSMGDKQTLLGSAVSRIIRRLAEPSADHGPVDLHVGVISSSLGTFGPNGACSPTNPDTNQNGHLVNKDSVKHEVVPGAEAGFLSLAPGGDITKLETDAKNLILAVGQNGCGFEAQLESLYRFLIQPDPPASIDIDPAAPQPVKFGPVDDELLAQRKAFLRPDSAVAIVMLTDEDDSYADPDWNHGTGWSFAWRTFPGSKVQRGTSAQGTTAARGTKICETDPSSAECISCAVCNRDPACKAKQDPNCSKSGVEGQAGEGYDGYYGPTDDDLNVRFFHMKQRYGVDPQFPIDRYLRGLSYRKVPDRNTEHDAVTGNYVHAETCTNPLFAAELPASSKDDYCHMPEGTRSRQLVLFQLIGGLPPGLAGASPSWTAILGQNPDRYDLSGIDPHMIQSIAPRPAITGGDPFLPRGNNGTDPVNGRDWNTKNKDLQYACTALLPTPRICSGNEGSCDCADDPAHAGTPASNAPLCAADGSATQIRAKAYPTVRELRLVKALGDRGLVGSICSVDPTSGYGPILENLATKLAPVLAK